MIIFQAFISFFATLFFSIIFNAPRKLLIACGFVGAIGWIVYYIANSNGLSDAVSIFLEASPLVYVHISLQESTSVLSSSLMYQVSYHSSPGVSLTMQQRT